MTEPDVAVTDFAIAALCVACSAGAARWPVRSTGLRGLWVLCFASVGLGALLGGLVHGFYLDATSVTNRVLWTATLMSLGVTSTAMWLIGIQLALPTAAASIARPLAVAQLALYVAVVLFVTREFKVAIAEYLPATLFLLAVFTIEYRRAPAMHLVLGIAAVLLTFAGAAVQQLRIGVHPRYFNHNALYHVIQGVSLVLLYVAARGTVRSVEGREGREGREGQARSVGGARTV